MIVQASNRAQTTIASPHVKTTSDLAAQQAAQQVDKAWIVSSFLIMAAFSAHHSCRPVPLSKATRACFLAPSLLRLHVRQLSWIAPLVSPARP